MFANNDFYDQISTEDGAKALINTIIEDYGVIDFLQCVFFDFNTADQERFLAMAQQRG